MQIDELDEMREHNRLAYLAQVREQTETEQEYRGSDALTAKSRAAKAQIRQTLAAARAARQHTTEETKS